MAARPRPKKPVAGAESYEASSTLIGPALAMPEQNALALSAAEGPPIDFQAKQDSIALVRRSAGAKLAPKVKRTTTEPANAKETKVSI